MYSLTNNTSGKVKQFSTDVEFINHVQDIFAENEKGNDSIQEPTTVNGCSYYVKTYCDNFTVSTPINTRQVNKAAQY